MAINFNSIQNALDKQEEKKKQKGTANQPSPTVSYTKAQKMASNRLHSDDVKLSYSVADTARNRKSTRPTPAQKKREEEKKQQGKTVASVEKQITKEKAANQKRTWDYGQSASADLAMSKSGQKIKQLDDSKRTAVDYTPSVGDQHGVLGQLGYAAETSLAGGLGVVDNAARNAYAIANRLMGMATGSFGTNPNKISDAFNRQAELVLGSSLAQDYKRNIEERYRPNSDDQKAAQLTAGAGALLPSIAASVATGGGSSLLGAVAKGSNAGLALMGAATMGGSATDGYAKTGDVDTALAYGALSGAVEVATEKMFAGIPGFPTSGLGETIQRVVGKMVKNPTTARFVTSAVDSLGEGFEEVVSSAVNPVLQRLTIDPNASNSSKEELLEAGINGALLSVLMQGGAEIAGKAVDVSSRIKPATRSTEDMLSEMVNMSKGATENTVASGEKGVQRTGFMEQVAETMFGIAPRGKELVVGDTPAILQQYGANPHKMTLSQADVRKIAYPKGYMGGKHNLGFGAVAQLPSQLEKPVAILKSSTQPNSLVVFTELLDTQQRPVMVPIHLNKAGNIGISNEVASMYGRVDFDNFISRQQREGNVLYENKEGALQQLPVSGLQLSEMAAEADPIFNVTQFADNSNGAESQLPRAGLQLSGLANTENGPISNPMLSQDNNGVNSSISRQNPENASPRSAGEYLRELAGLPAIEAENGLASGEMDTVGTQGHTPEMQKTIREYQASTDPKLVDFSILVLAAPNANTDNLKYSLGEVRPQESVDIQRLTGIDTTGYQHNISGRTVRHINKNHGASGKTDRSMADLNDIGRIRYVIDSYDNMDMLDEPSSEYRDSKNRQAKLVRYGKQVDGTYYVVEAVPDTKAQTLQIVSAYRNKNKKQHSALQMYRPLDNVQDDHAAAFSNPMLSQDNNGVNSSISRQSPENASPRSAGEYLRELAGLPAIEAENGLASGENTAKATTAPADQQFMADLEGRTGVKTAVGAITDRNGKPLPAGEAMYDPATDTITFAPGSSKAQVIRGVAMHELTHVLQRADANGTRTAAYQNFEGFILKRLEGDLEKQVVAKQTKHLMRGNALTQQGAIDELVADYTRDKLFQDPQAIRQLVKEQRSVAQKIYDYLVDTCNRLQGFMGNAELAELYQGRDLFREALEGRVSGDGQGSKQFSFEGTTKDGIRVYKSDFPAEMPMSERIAAFKDRIATIFNLGGVELVADGKKIRVLGDRFTRKESIYGDKKGTNIEKTNKVNALYDLADILETSKFKGKNREASYLTPQSQGSVPKPKNDAHKNVQYWYKYTNTVVFDGIPFDVTFNIRDLGDTQYQYLIDFKQKKDYGLSNTVGNANLLQADRNLFLDPNVSQSDTEVNSSLSDSLANDTYHKQYSLTDENAQATPEPLAGQQPRGMAKNSIPKAVAAGVEGMAEVQAELSPESQVYTPESLETSQQKGLDYIREQGGVEQANSQTLSQMRERHSLNTTEQVAAVELVKYYAQDRNPGDRQKAVALTEVLMETATEMGRAINALKLLQKNTPEGLLAFANQYIKKLQDPKVKLTNQDQANLTSLGKLITGWDTLSNLSVEERNSQIDAVLAETQASPNLKGWVKKALNEKGIDLEDALTAKAMDLIANKSPSTWRQKFRALQRISMLSNPKTHVRNVMGNAVVTAGETLAHPISWLADTALSKMTGQRTHAAIKGNDVVKGISDGINKANVQRRLGIDLEGHQRYQEGGGQLQPKAFNPELANNWLSKGALTFLDKVDGIISTALNYGDTGFFHGYYQDALGQMMRANKVSEATPEMFEAASESALRRVFQDDNAVTDTMQKLRNDFPFIGEIVAPFVKTPSNVVKIGIEYTPVGIAEGMMKAFVGENSIRKLQQQGVDTMALQRQCAELIGRGSIGTVLMLLGMALGQAKVGTGDEEEHQNQNQFNRMIGKIPNSFKIGDTYIDLSSLQSAAVPLLAGSAIGAARKDQKGTAEDYLRGLLAGTVKAGNTATEMPMMQGISELLGGGYEKQGFAETLAKLGADAVSQIVPFGSLGRQAANAIDPYSWDRSSDSMLERELVNPVKAQIPGLANNFPIRYDTLGNPQKTYEADTAAGRLFNVFLNPLNTAKDKSTPVTDEIQRLFEESRDKGVFPARAPYNTSYGNQAYDLGSAERQGWQGSQGQTLAGTLADLFASEAYRDAPTSQKVKMLDYAKDFAHDQAKGGYLAGQGVGYEGDAAKKYQDALDAGLSTSQYLVGAAAVSGSENNRGRLEGIIRASGLSNEEKAQCAAFFTNDSKPSRYLEEALDRGLDNSFTEAYETCYNFNAKNEKGKTIPNLKKQRCFDYIKALPWRAADKLWFYTEVFDYKLD